eukprot:TRINITY_DN0_c221_g1_i5.p1 TRINITY_DN0_c221_g1~~TRINITY_DN0_c221_g1_i5.p1  ORF type:complete len:121 (-),score=25.81 TRINITY_DN0_c221_g1_i5:69-431(-)
MKAGYRDRQHKRYRSSHSTLKQKTLVKPGLSLAASKANERALEELKDFECVNHDLKSDSDTSAASKSDTALSPSELEKESEMRKNELRKVLAGEQGGHYMLVAEHKYLNVEKLIPLPDFL